MIAGLLLCLAGLFWPRTEDRRPLTVAVNIWPGAEGLLMARETVRTKGMHINFVEMSWSTSAMGAFHKRVVDAAILTLDELLRLEDEGARPRAVLVLGISKGSDAILARPGLKSFADLRGKRVGVELRSLAEYLLLHALEAHGMTLRDVKIVPLNMAETETAYDDGDVDAVVAADPWRVRLEGKGAVVLFDSSTMGLELSRVLAVSEDVMEEYANELRNLVAEHVKSSGLPQDVNDAVLRREGLTLQQWQEALRMIQFPDASENLRLLKPGAASLEECLQRMMVLMRSRGLLTHDVDVRGLLRPNLLEERAP